MSERKEIKGYAYGYINNITGSLPSYDEQKYYIEKWAAKNDMKLRMLMSDTDVPPDNDKLTLEARPNLRKLIGFIGGKTDYFITFSIIRLATSLGVAEDICQNIMNRGSNVVLTKYPTLIMSTPNILDTWNLRLLSVYEEALLKYDEQMKIYYENDDQ